MNRAISRRVATASGWLQRSCVVWSACGSRTHFLRAHWRALRFLSLCICKVAHPSEAKVSRFLCNSQLSRTCVLVKFCLLKGDAFCYDECIVLFEFPHPDISIFFLEDGCREHLRSPALPHDFVHKWNKVASSCTSKVFRPA